MRFKPSEKVIYFFVAFGALLSGLNCGVLSGAFHSLNRDFNISAMQEGLLTAAIFFGVIPSCLITGRLNDIFGRKKLLYVASLIFISGGLLFIVINSYLLFFIVRIYVGIGIGIVSVTIPAYLTEVSIVTNRNRVTALYQFLISAGLLLGYVIDFVFIPYENEIDSWPANWQTMFSLTVIPALLMFLFLIFVPESPLFVYKKGDIKKSRHILEVLHKKWPHYIDEILAGFEKIDSSHPKTSEVFSKKNKALFIAGALAVFQQFIGVNMVFYYGPILAMEINPDKNLNVNSLSFLEENEFIAIVFGVFSIIGCIMSLYILGRAKNKSLLLFGVLFMGLFSVFVSILGFLGKLHILGIVGIVLIVFYIIIFSFTWGPLTWNIISQISPARFRNINSAIATTLNWVSNIIVVITFPLISNFNPETSDISIEIPFLIIGAVSIVAALFVRHEIPETSSLTLHQIETLFVKEENEGEEKQTK